MVRCNIACRTRFWNMSTIQTCNDIKGRFAHWRLLWRPWSSSCALESGTQEVATIGATCLSQRPQRGIKGWLMWWWNLENRMEFGCFSWVVTSPRTLQVPSLVVTFANSPFRSEPLGRGSRRAPGKMEAGQMRLDFATLDLFYVLQRRNVQQKPARRNIM